MHVLLMNPLIAKLALDWLAAEREANPEQYSGPFSNDDVAIASDRCYQVCAGEVRWSETSPGDKAVWKGRLRDVSMFERWVRQDDKADIPVDSNQTEVRSRRRKFSAAQVRSGTPWALGAQSGSRLQGYRERLWWNYYDTIADISDLSFSRAGDTKLFDNKNIGNTRLTNLMVAGQFGFDQTFVALRFYVWISSLDALRWAASNVSVEFVIGMKLQVPPMFVRDLFLGVTPGRPLVVQIRQNISVPVRFHTAPPADLAPFDLTFHVEGLLSRDNA